MSLEAIALQTSNTPGTFSSEEIALLSALNPKLANRFASQNPTQGDPMHSNTASNLNYYPDPASEMTGNGVVFPSAMSGRGMEGGFLPLGALLPMMAPIATGILGSVLPHAISWLGKKAGIIKGQGIINPAKIRGGNLLPTIDSLAKQLGKNPSSRDLWSVIRDNARKGLDRVVEWPNASARARIIDATINRLIPRQWSRSLDGIRDRDGKRELQSPFEFIMGAPVRHLLNRAGKIARATPGALREAFDSARNYMNQHSADELMSGSGRFLDRLKRVGKVILKHTVDPIAKLAKMGKDKLIEMVVKKFELGDVAETSAKSLTDLPLNWIAGKAKTWAETPDEPEEPTIKPSPAEPETVLIRRPKDPVPIAPGSAPPPDKVGEILTEMIAQRALPKYIPPASAEGLPSDPGTQLYRDPNAPPSASPAQVASAHSSGTGRRRAPPRRRATSGGAKKKGNLRAKSSGITIRWL